MPSEVSDYFTSSENDILSVSAVSQRRALLRPEIFINKRFLSSIDNLSTLNGYYILAQDGYDINLPFLQDDTQIAYGLDSVVCQYHLNALYDCINHVFLESRIDLPIKKSEISALIDFINHRNYPQNSIITADRGYESYNLISHYIENNQFVFISSKSVFDYLETCNRFYDLNFRIEISISFKPLGLCWPDTCLL